MGLIDKLKRAGQKIGKAAAKASPDPHAGEPLEALVARMKGEPDECSPRGRCILEFAAFLADEAAIPLATQSWAMTPSELEAALEDLLDNHQRKVTPDGLWADLLRKVRESQGIVTLDERFAREEDPIPKVELGTFVRNIPTFITTMWTAASTAEKAGVWTLTAPLELPLSSLNGNATGLGLLVLEEALTLRAEGRRSKLGQRPRVPILEELQHLRSRLIPATTIRTFLEDVAHSSHDHGDDGAYLEWLERGKETLFADVPSELRLPR